MATVRIYKVAELLNTSSQEVMALLKRDHGIEVKSASSTIEEVVAREFVSRMSRQRGLNVPANASMADTPAPVKGKKPGGRAPEPVKPAAAVLPPPRLVKTAKPVVDPGVPLASDVEIATEEYAESEPEPEPIQEPAFEEARIEASTQEATDASSVDPEAAAPAAPPLAARRVGSQEPTGNLARPRPPIGSQEPTGNLARPRPSVGSQEPTGNLARPPVRPPAPPAPTLPPRPVVTAPTGRIVPPTLRLRVEDPRTGQAPPAPPRRPMLVRPSAPAPSAASQVPTGNLSRPAAARPGAPGAVPGRPAPPRPAGGLPPRPGSALGGPRPLPSQPVRPSMPARPGMPAYRPPMHHRPGSQRPGSRRDQGPRVQSPVPMQAPPPPVTRTITLAEGMTVADLATKLDVKAKDVMKKLMERRMMVTINSTLDDETAAMIAREFGADVKMQTFEEEMLQVEAEDIDPADLVTRAPVVTVMGHVDHGKTTLLDAIRSARVAEREAGGITQHIGAYAVTVNDRNVVFLDTPGHEAFTMMRARGSRVTDVVILVVAADDGVMPQTREAIDHAKAAGVPILVAINKIDKPNANPERVKKELADLGLTPEAWGGTTVMVEVSAKKKENLELLLEMILLVTELGELKANPKRNASGTVLEAKLDKGRGPVATILVQDGTLRVGDTLIAGTIVGKVRALIDDRGRQLKTAGPATPVEVLGLGGLPLPGDAFQALTDAAKARQIAYFRQSQAKEKAHAGRGSRLTLESLQAQIAEGGVKELPIIIKADVQGSAEVLADTLTKLTDEKVKIRIIHSGVGAINESDVLLASASNAIVIGFNVRPDRNAADVADREKVDVRLHSIIYNVTDEMKKAMAGLLDPTFREVRVGTAEVRDIFKTPKFGTIAGCMVREGRITRAGDTQARLLRDGQVVYEGKIGSLRRFKDDVSEVKAGFECGIGFEKYNDIKVGDMIEAFAVERVATPV
ncbi:MAG: translation initiation factor IF-2 [Acidobacteriota bacterium]|nr:translation initiation factor IF-2 [Acidobacteriota bacterium]